ncbi:MAG: GFA family protein [Alphaproteobacteria bacterium]|nr:GFA family protein [Alphaproteobacteria bacterium]
MPEVAKGSCLCGAVRFSVPQTFPVAYFCHCAQCRKITGTAYASNLFADPAGFVWMSGEDRIQRFDHPSRGFTKAFCRDCGSGIPYLNSAGTRMVVPAGSLDTEPDIGAADRIFWDDRADWCDIVDLAPHHCGFPD